MCHGPCRFAEALPHYEAGLAAAQSRCGRRPLRLVYAFADALERGGERLADAAAEFERGLDSDMPLVRPPSEADRAAVSRWPSMSHSCHHVVVACTPSRADLQLQRSAGSCG